jgi:hypothetical protein
MSATIVSVTILSPSVTSYARIGISVYVGGSTLMHLGTAIANAVCAGSPAVRSTSKKCRKCVDAHDAVHRTGAATKPP